MLFCSENWSFHTLSVCKPQHSIRGGVLLTGFIGLFFNLCFGQGFCLIYCLCFYVCFCLVSRFVVLVSQNLNSCCVKVQGQSVILARFSYFCISGPFPGPCVLVPVPVLQGWQLQSAGWNEILNLRHTHLHVFTNFITL